MVCVIVRKLKDSYEERKAHELKMKNNMPFRADEYRAMLSRMYPHRNWKRTQFCTNFLTRSPVVVGNFPGYHNSGKKVFGISDTGDFDA